MYITMLLAATVRFNHLTYRVSENESSAKIELILDNPVSINVTVTVNTIDVRASGEYYSI